MSNNISVDVVAAKIILIRGKRVMSDKDLAKLYEVDTRQLTRQVRCNIDRFPEDFMFQLTKEEVRNLMCQNGTSSWGGTRKLPYVLRSKGLLCFQVYYIVRGQYA
jgi:ORF6N domain